jgi:flagellin
MSIKLGSNQASLNTQRRLGESSAALVGIYERLSSGQRINRASDDAAGLAIADDLNSKGRIYAQGIRNGNDGISLLNIADSAIDALSGVVARIRELTEQSANGTYSAVQRQALDNEAQALSEEFTRITQTTSFNGLKIFDGSLGEGIRLQLGIGVAESVNFQIGGAVGSGEFEEQTRYSTEGAASRGLALGDLNGDGILDLVSAGYEDTSPGYVNVRLGQGNGSFGAALSFSTEGTGSLSVTLGDVDGDGILDLVTGGNLYEATINGYATVRLGNGNGTFGSATTYSTEGSRSNAVKLGDLNGDGLLDLITAGHDDSENGWATVRLGSGGGAFGVATAYATEGKRSAALAIADINGDGIQDLISAGFDDSLNGFATIRLGLGDGSFAASSSYASEGFSSRAVQLGDLNGDGSLDLVTAGYDDSNNGYATVRLGDGSGNFGSATTYSTEAFRSNALSLADLNGDGLLDLITTGMDDSLNGFASIRLGRGNGTFGQQAQFSTEAGISHALALGDVDRDGVLDLLTAGADDSSNGSATIRLGRDTEGLGALLGFSLKTRSDAMQAMGMLDQTIANLTQQRGVIGASQSRLNIAVNNIISVRENFVVAESRIRDADIAAEAANLVRVQILQQAATSVLAQANGAPALALQLLSS